MSFIYFSVGLNSSHSLQKEQQVPKVEKVLLEVFLSRFQVCVGQAEWQTNQHTPIINSLAPSKE